MAAEAVHFTALDDLANDPRVPEAARASLSAAGEHARLGALLIDLPYFDRFEWEAARYLLRRPAPPTPWGDRFHRRAPVRMAAELLAEAARHDSPELRALALGYVTHVGVDSVLHPPVNRLVERLQAEAGAGAPRTEADWHRHIEKYQSELLHRERLGRRFLGTWAYWRHLGMDTGRLLAEPEVAGAIAAALDRALGGSPSAAQWRAWARGYREYALVLASPLGRLYVPERAERARERYYINDTVDTPAAYRAALDACAALLQAATPLLSRVPLPAHVVSDFLVAVPERSLDYPERPFVATC